MYRWFISYVYAPQLVSRRGKQTTDYRWVGVELHENKHRDNNSKTARGN